MRRHPPDPEVTGSDDLVSDPVQLGLQAAFAAWRPILDGRPRIAIEVYFWEASKPETGKPGASV